MQYLFKTIYGVIISVVTWWSNKIFIVSFKWKKAAVVGVKLVTFIKYCKVWHNLCKGTTLLWIISIIKQTPTQIKSSDWYHTTLYIQKNLVKLSNIQLMFIKSYIITYPQHVEIGIISETSVNINLTNSYGLQVYLFHIIIIRSPECRRYLNVSNRL